MAGTGYPLNWIFQRFSSLARLCDTPDLCIFPHILLLENLAVFKIGRPHHRICVRRVNPNVEKGGLRDKGQTHENNPNPFCDLKIIC
jgi:hypothetical protein